MSPSIEQLNGSLGRVQDRLDAVDLDLIGMPTWKRGSRWHLDRTAERQRLLQQRESIRNQILSLAQSN
jgi:hypothetical protein